MAEREFTSASFHAFLAEGRLMGTRCRSCGALSVPPRPLCPACASDGAEWVEVKGEGTLKAFTIVYVAPTAMLASGYGRDRPYCSGIVELKAGPSVSAQILGVDVSQPERIRIGAPVRMSLVQRGKGDQERTYLGFEVTR